MTPLTTCLVPARTHRRKSARGSQRGQSNTNISAAAAAGSRGIGRPGADGIGPQGARECTIGRARACAPACKGGLTAVDANENVPPERVVFLVQLVHCSGRGLERALVLGVDPALPAQRCRAEASHCRDDACERPEGVRGEPWSFRSALKQSPPRHAAPSPFPNGQPRCSHRASKKTVKARRMFLRVTGKLECGCRRWKLAILYREANIRTSRARFRAEGHTRPSRACGHPAYREKQKSRNAGSNGGRCGLWEAGREAERPLRCGAPCECPTRMASARAFGQHLAARSVSMHPHASGLCSRAGRVTRMGVHTRWLQMRALAPRPRR